MDETTAKAPSTLNPNGPKGLAPGIFGSILGEELNWISFPAYPPQVRLAVLVGDPQAAGPYVVRVRLPGGTKFMPHRHKEDRIYTIISGVFYVGRGEKFDPDALQAYAPGSVIILPGNTHHFHWAKSGEYVAQVSAYGPLSIDYLDHQDDPRRSV
jgi:quercetin dioxygenase-like cupin family protein